MRAEGTEFRLEPIWEPIWAERESANGLFKLCGAR